MWIVKNLLKAAIRIKDIDVTIAPLDFFDLDSIGRDRADASKHLNVAFEEGFLEQIKKDDAGVASSFATAQRGQGSELNDIRDQMREMKEMMLAGQQQQAQAQQPAMPNLADTFADLKTSISEGMKEAMGTLMAQKATLQTEKKKLIQSDLNESEMKIRLMMIEEKEKELEANFEELGAKAEGDGESENLADLLGNM